jgi:hypothetical protein
MKGPSVLPGRSFGVQQSRGFHVGWRTACVVAPHPPAVQQALRAAVTCATPKQYPEHHDEPFTRVHQKGGTRSAGAGGQQQREQSGGPTPHEEQLQPAHIPDVDAALPITSTSGAEALQGGVATPSGPRIGAGRRSGHVVAASPTSQTVWSGPQAGAPLTRAIVACRTLHELARVLAAHHRDMDAVHLATCLHRLAGIARAPNPGGRPPAAAGRHQQQKPQQHGAIPSGVPALPGGAHSASQQQETAASGAGAREPGLLSGGDDGRAAYAVAPTGDLRESAGGLESTMARLPVLDLDPPQFIEQSRSLDAARAVDRQRQRETVSELAGCLAAQLLPQLHVSFFLNMRAGGQEICYKQPKG